VKLMHFRQFLRSSCRIAVVGVVAGCSGAEPPPRESAPKDALPASSGTLRQGESAIERTATAADSSQGAPQAANAIAPTSHGTDSIRWVQRGERLYARMNCGRCHTIGAGYMDGPDLEGVTDRRTFSWIIALLTDTENMIQIDPDLQQLRMEHFVDMPNLDLSASDARALHTYLQAASARSKRSNRD
jgi:mono/diheme cytochrome c family protein